MKNDDVALIRRILAGDEIAFAELVKKYQKPVHTLAWRKIGDFHIAEDITQEVFLKVYQGLRTLKHPKQFSGWVYVITANLCATWLRKKRIQTQPLEDAERTMPQRDAYSRHVVEERTNTAAESQREVVKKLLAKLKESERTVMALHYLGEMTVEEISQFLGVSASTIKSRLRRARQRLQKEETMIREALDHFQVSPNLTDNIMREVAHLKPAAPAGSKPLVPWAIAVSTLAVVLLMLGVSSRYLARFQKPYSFSAASEMKVELINAPVVLNLESEPDDRTQLGNANAQGKNNGAAQQVNNAAPLDLGTIITKMKHYDNSVISVTGDFVMERHRGGEIEKDEYTLTFEGEKVRVEREIRRGVNLPLVEYWDGKQQWGVYRPDNLLFKVEIAPNEESTVLEKIQQAFKQVGIEIADDVPIVPGDLSNSFKVIKKDKTYFVLFVGQTTLEVYDGSVGYSVRPQWTIIPSDIDPRFWLTFPKLGSDNSYLSEPLWHLLENHESELIGSEVLNGEMTSVIRLNLPAWSVGDFKMPARSFKLWISHNIGFRPVKLEETYIGDDGTDIHTREIEYHEYLPNVWFPKRIETSTVPEKLPEQQQGANFTFKNVLLTKQCQINTDVSQLLSLDLSTDTSVYDYRVRHPRMVDDLEVKPNFQTQLGGSDVPSQNTGSEQQVNNATTPDSLQWSLPEGAKARLGKGWINDIAYSPDNTLLAVASSVGVWLYDVQTGQELDLLTSHTNWVRTVTFSPDGNTLASGNSDSTVCLWLMQTRILHKTLTGYTGTGSNLAFSADGTLLASGGKDNTVRIWDVQTDELQKTLKGHTHEVFGVAFSSDGTTLASGSADNTIRLWDVETETLHKTLNLIELTEEDTEIEMGMEMVFSPDGNTLATWTWGWDIPIRLWGTQTGALHKTLKGEENDVVKDMAFSPDGKTLASAMDNRTVRLWNIQTGERHRILTGHKHFVSSVAFSPDGNTLTSGSYDTTLRVWNAQTGELQKTLTGYMNEVLSVAFSPDGKTIVNSMDEDAIYIWDAQTGALQKTLIGEHMYMSPITSVAVSPDGKTLASGDYSRAVCLWDAQTGKLRKTPKGHQDTVKSVAFSPDGKMLASASWDKTLHLYDAQTGELQKTFAGHTNWVLSVVFSPDGKMLASGSQDQTVRVWDVEMGELRNTFNGHADTINSVAFSPDNKTLASGSKDSTIHLWDAQTGALQKTLMRHTNEVTSVAFSPDGNTLASASGDKTIHLWDVETGELRKTFTGHTAWVWSIAFSPDGKTLVSGSRDGTLLLWEIIPD